MKKSTEIMRTAAEEMVPGWVIAMRQAAMKHLTEADVEEIVRGQVERGKKGDKNAIRFVFDQLMGGAAFKGATFQQTNIYGDSGELAGATKALPGTPRKQEVMRRRVDAGLPAMHPGDATKDLT